MSVISFARGFPGPDLLPIEEFGDCAQAALARDGATALNYGPPFGYLPLREWLADRHDVDVARVMITNGSLQAFSFIARHHVQAGAKVFVEAPCYDRSLQILRRLGADVETVPLSDDGLDIDALDQALARTDGPSLVYTIPTFQNPSGRTLSEPNRHRLIEVAREHGAPILEDDPYGLLRFGGNGLPRLFELAGGEGVMLLSSFSKTVAPGIRVGFAILPEELMGAMQTLILENYVSPVMFVEATLHEFVSRGRFDPNVEEIQAALARPPRRDDLGPRARDAGGNDLERARRRLLPLGRPACRAERREPARPGRRGRGRLHQGPRLLPRRRRGIVASPRVLIRAARGDRRGHRAARTARSRRARRSCVNRPPFETAHLDELARFGGEFDTIPIRIPLGIAAFGVNAYGAREVGGHVIEEHDELGAGAGGHEELYVVLSGRARFVVAGNEVDGPAGTLLFVRDPATRRGATAAEPDTVVLVVGGTVGKPFQPSPWEAWLEALPLYEAGDFTGAAAVLERALEAYPGNPNVLYNLACCEALSGRRDDALSPSRPGRRSRPASPRLGRDRLRISIRSAARSRTSRPPRGRGAAGVPRA